jgi:hypothetical protein
MQFDLHDKIKMNDQNITKNDVTFVTTDVFHLYSCLYAIIQPSVVNLKYNIDGNYINKSVPDFEQYYMSFNTC